MPRNHDEDQDEDCQQDIDEILCDIGERLEMIEKKLDMLVAQSQANTFSSRRDFSPRGRDAAPRGSEREGMTKVICAKCGDSCEVPFRPSGDRPVYCRNCFGKQGGKGRGEGFKNKRAPHSGFKPRKDRY